MFKGFSNLFFDCSNPYHNGQTDPTFETLIILLVIFGIYGLLSFILDIQKAISFTGKLIEYGYWYLKAKTKKSKESNL